MDGRSILVDPVARQTAGYLVLLPVVPVYTSVILGYENRKKG